MSKGFVEIPISEWTEMRERLTRLEEQMEFLVTNHLKHIEQEVQWIRDRLSRGYRPPWSVVAVVTLLTSLCVGLIVHVVCK
jgi:hypothetical protein